MKKQNLRTIDLCTYNVFTKLTLTALFTTGKASPIDNCYSKSHSEHASII